MAKICGGARRLRPNPVLLCAKHLGVSPTSYLRFRRMSLVYRALWCEDPDATNVAEATRRYSFSGLGRFAGAYRHLFGRLPSASLRWSLHPGMAHLAAPSVPAAWETFVASASDLDRRRDEAIDYESFQLLKRPVRA